MKSSKSISPFYLVIFLIWPFYSFILRLKSKGGLGLYIAFGAFFGFTMLQGGDTYSLTNILKEVNSSDKTFDYFRDMLSQNVDFVYPSILFLVGIFTDNPQVLFAFLAIPFVYFIYKLIESIKFHYQFSNKEILRVLLFISIALSIQVWWLAGRWNLAAIVFAYGIFNYFHTYEKYFLFFIFITPLIHWTFVLVIPVFLSYFFLKNRLTLYFYLFICSFFINAIGVSLVSDIFTRYSTDQIQETRSIYTTEEYIESTNTEISNTNWYVYGHEKLLTYSLLISLVFLYYKRRNQMNSLPKYLHAFLCFALFFFAVFNSFSTSTKLKQ